MRRKIVMFKNLSDVTGSKENFTGDINKTGNTFSECSLLYY